MSSGPGQSQNDEEQDDSNDAEQSQNNEGQADLSDPEHMAEPVGSIEDKQNDYILFPGELENMLNDATLNVEHAEGPKDV